MYERITHIPIDCFWIPPPWGRIMTISARENDSCGQYGSRSTNTDGHGGLATTPHYKKKHRQASLRRAKWNGMSSLWRQDFPSRGTSPSRASQNIQINFTADTLRSSLRNEKKKYIFVARMVYWSCSSILQLHHSNSGIISPDCHACSLLITTPDVSAMINYRTWTFGGGGGGWGDGGEILFPCDTISYETNEARRVATKHFGTKLTRSVVPQIFGSSNDKERHVRGIWHYGRQKRCLQGSEVETWEKQPTWKTGVDGKTLLKLNFKKWDGEAWPELIRLRIGTGGGYLWMQ